MVCSKALYISLVLALDVARLSMQVSLPEKPDTSPVIAMKGRSVILHCPADKEVTRDRIAWIRQNSRTIISLHGELVSQSNKYAIIDKAGGAYDLKLLDVTFEDEGIYICQINSVPMQNKIIRLIVVMSPQFLANSTSSSTITVREGESLKLACPVVGVPTPKVFWRTPMDRKMTFKHSGDIFFTSHAKKSHHGQYSCIAKNGYAPSVAKTFHVVVEYAPLIKVYSSSNSSAICIGCKVEAQPWPSEFYLTEQGHMIASQTIPGQDLLVCNVGYSRTDRQYTCQVTNTVGMTVKTLLLQGQEENNLVEIINTPSTRPLPVYPTRKASTQPQRYRQMTSTNSPERDVPGSFSNAFQIMSSKTLIFILSHSIPHTTRSSTMGDSDKKEDPAPAADAKAAPAAKSEGVIDKNPEVWKAVAMADHFEKIQKLPEKLDGVPNFRRVPGYKVYCCGQPTKDGFKKALEKVCGDKYPKTGPIIWINMRQEPIVYVNGNPVCARPANKIGEYAELGDVTRGQVKADEEEFLKVLESRSKNAGGKLKVVDVAKVEKEVEVKELITLHNIIEELKTTYPGLTHNRIPVCNSSSPNEEDFDTLCNAILGTNVNAPVIVNCQVGLSRSTTGCVCACLFREFQLSASYEGLIETVPGVNLQLLRMDNYTIDKSKDTLFRGEFQVVKELIAAFPDGEASKRECDKVIDKNGPAPKGTGIKQLRENIAESKLSYEIMDDAAQAFLKTKIMDNIQKYFYLICFTGYLREQSKIAVNGISDEEKKAFALTGGKVSTPTENLKLTRTFQDWMTEHSNFRDICAEGKGKLQWERDIPQDALDNLQNLAQSDFHKNLGKIIHDIYLTGHNLFKDMPQGDHKKRAKYRFASKTLMRILPDNIKNEVEELIAKETMTLDLYEILGQCTWNQSKSL